MTYNINIIIKYYDVLINVLIVNNKVLKMYKNKTENSFKIFISKY